ncbi:HNH endonuclease [Nostoc sp.]|uniref:HNH endonuclease n=1 Tax=Nostoc sp. TaxID=1180 RepID=UPI002FF7540B
MDYQFIRGQSYKRRDIYRIISLPEDTKGGNWETGYNRRKQDYFIFCNIGVAGTTGHDYNNHFLGNDLVWFGKNGSKIQQPTIQNLIHPKGKIYIFKRSSNKEPFIYLGLGKAKSFEETSPVKIIWEFIDNNEFNPISLPEEVIETEKYFEGSIEQIAVNVYERNPDARQKCIKHYGGICQVCGFSFEEVYGVIGEGYIHVHHLKPLSEIGKKYELDPIQDLRPVCANCHAMIQMICKTL